MIDGASAPCFNIGVVNHNFIKDTKMKDKITNAAIYVFAGSVTVYFACLVVEQLSK